MLQSARMKQHANLGQILHSQSASECTIPLYIQQSLVLHVVIETTDKPLQKCLLKIIIIIIIIYYFFFKQSLPQGIILLNGSGLKDPTKLSILYLWLKCRRVCIFA